MGVMPRVLQGFWRVVRVLVVAAAAVSGAGIVFMMCVTCLDVILRAFGRPLVGAFDLVRIAGALTMACALPYTTAVKGHVAIEYFFHKLSRRARVVVDSLTRGVGMGLFGVLAWYSVTYGLALRRAGEVSSTLRLPVFWVPWVMAFACGLVALVILYNLLHPGREMIKP